MLDIPLQLVTYKVPSVSASRGNLNEEQTFHLVYVAEHPVEGDFNPK
jgi:hypothetical protein